MNRIAFLVAVIALFGSNPSQAQIVTLQNATATFSQTVFGGQPVAQSIDGNFSGTNGWAVATSSGFNGAASQTAVWETVNDVNTGGISFRMHFLATVASQALLGRFRFSTTTDDRSMFADGLASGGDVTANWVVLTNPSVVGPAGMTFTTLGDNSVLAGGTVPSNGVYFVSYSTPLAGVTGFRLEVLEDPSLPGGNGPGFAPLNGNFALTEIEVVPEPSSMVLAASVAAAGLFIRRRQRRLSASA